MCFGAPHYTVSGPSWEKRSAGHAEPLGVPPGTARLLARTPGTVTLGEACAQVLPEPHVQRQDGRQRVRASRRPDAACEGFRGVGAWGRAATRREAAPAP